MKEPISLSVSDWLQRPADFDHVLDARSPGEFALDHLPGALSTPVLDDAQRIRVGTLYKQSPFEAKRVGAALVARNIGQILEQQLPDGVDRDWRPLVYCWRGGNRSGALATVMARVGWRTHVLTGGYQAFRRHLLLDLPSLVAGLSFRVVVGRTGSGKSRLLEHLTLAGAQVLDLEQLAQHRGSVLGNLPDIPQPSQKGFETGVWHRLRSLDPRRIVYVESESKKVGNVHLPDALMARIRDAHCVVVNAADDLRSALLIDQYRHFLADPTTLNQRLERLIVLHGRAVIGQWQQMAIDGSWPALVTELLQRHYDPAYDRSIHRNFRLVQQAPVLSLTGVTDADFEQLARAVISSEAGSSIALTTQA